MENVIKKHTKPTEALHQLTMAAHNTALLIRALETAPPSGERSMILNNVQLIFGLLEKSRSVLGGEGSKS